MGNVNKNAKKQQRTATAAQRAQRIRAAEERELLAKVMAAAEANTKKIFTIVVCVILVLALGIPTVALSVLSM